MTSRSSARVDGAADGDVDVRGEPFLGFDGGEVLQVVADQAAQVLDEPVEQRGEVQRVPGRPRVVVGVRVGGCSVLADPAIGRAGQRHEQGRPEGLAVRRGVGLADGPVADRAPGQRRGVLPAPGGPVAVRPVRQYVPAHPGVGDLLVQLADPLLQLGRVEALIGEGVPVGLGLGAVGDQGLLLGGGRVGFDDGFLVEVPAFAALGGAQDPGAFRTGRADRGQGVPAGDEDLLDMAGVDLGAAQLHRPLARAMLDSQVLDDIPGQRHRQPLRPRPPPVCPVTSHHPRHRRRRVRRSRTGGIQPAGRGFRYRLGRVRSRRPGRARPSATRSPS